MDENKTTDQLDEEVTDESSEASATSEHLTIRDRLKQAEEAQADDDDSIIVNRHVGYKRKYKKDRSNSPVIYFLLAVGILFISFLLKTLMPA